jgi:hypothetical protein
VQSAQFYTARPRAAGYGGAYTPVIAKLVDR